MLQILALKIIMNLFPSSLICKPRVAQFPSFEKIIPSYYSSYHYISIFKRNGTEEEHMGQLIFIFFFFVRLDYNIGKGEHTKATLVPVT